MTNKEINFRSILFLIIGIILVLSLVICIYVLNSERDLVKTSVIVEKVELDANDKGENDVTVSYEVDGKKYNYNFFYGVDVNKGDKLDIYYHKKNVSKAQSYKTSYFILVGPIFGLLLCVWGLVETFKKKEVEEENNIYETQVLNVIDDNTQQLSIITDDDIVNYEKLPEEKMESKIGIVRKEKKKVERKKKTNKVKKIIPISYYVAKDGLVCSIKDDDKIVINFENIRGIKREINRDEDITKMILILDDYECHLKEIEGIDLKKISLFINNKLSILGIDCEDKVIKK